MLRLEKAMKAKWSVLAVYENAAARELAMQFCDTLVQRFWSELSFELSWCDWTALEETESSKEAARKAREADLIVTATSSRGIIARHVKTWLELALRDRGDHEGVLVGLPVAEAESTCEVGAMQVYLRKLAHDAGMDYLTAVPQSLPDRVPESVESCHQRATQITSVLDTILRRSSVPPKVL
jgi:hypothetical protein